MNGIYVLLMLWTTGSHNGGVGVVQQEFTSAANCEAARVELAKAHARPGLVLGAQGCFKK